MSPWTSSRNGNIKTKKPRLNVTSEGGGVESENVLSFQGLHVYNKPVFHI